MNILKILNRDEIFKEIKNKQRFKDGSKKKNKIKKYKMKYSNE
jgi:hypothetical protein